MKKILFALLLLIANYCMAQDFTIEYGIRRVLNPIFTFENPYYYYGGINNGSASILVIGGPQVNMDFMSSEQRLKDVGMITLPNYSFTSNPMEVLNINDYKNLCSITHSNFDLAVANHARINQDLSVIADVGKVIACKATAKVLTKKISSYLDLACVATVKNKYAGPAICGLAVSLHTQIGKKVTQKIVYEGCTFLVEEAPEFGEKVVKITMEWINEVGSDINDIKLWLTFVNSVEGMMWISNEINKQ